MKTLKNIWSFFLQAFSRLTSKVKSILKSNRSAGSNSSYGASELKKNYQKFFRHGFEFAVILHVVVLSSYLLANYFSSKDKGEEYDVSKRRIVNVTLTDLAPPPPVNEEEEFIPPKVVEQSEIPKKDLTALEPEPVKKEKAEEQTIKTQKQLEEIKTPVSDVGDTVSFSYSGPVKVEKEKIEKKIEKEEKPVLKEKKEKTIYRSFEVEKPPEAVNLSQVQSSMKYPEIAVQANIEGRVTVKVLVGKDGSVIRVGSLTGPDVFHEEVRDKVRDLLFTPGLQNGKPVKVWVTVPFNFRLK